jgi:hypothetical protein
VARTYYRTDEDNSPWTINLLVKIGGGNPRTGQPEGIHWHMTGSNIVQYITTDRKRQEIPWVRLIDENGDTTVYTNPDMEMPDLDDPTTEIRTLDCIDCHNRPSHMFTPPAVALNLALSTRQISPELPYIRSVGLDLLNADYETRDDAMAALSNGLTEYYQDEYAEMAMGLGDEIEAAASVLQDIYRKNFFPEMKTDYRARENNLSHFVNDGCFRCHDGMMADADGNTVSTACETCHVIVAQGPSENTGDLESNLTGLEFQHPEDIELMWQEMRCTECHDPESGY